MTMTNIANDDYAMDYEIFKIARIKFKFLDNSITLIQPYKIFGFELPIYKSYIYELDQDALEVIESLYILDSLNNIMNIDICFEMYNDYIYDINGGYYPLVHGINCEDKLSLEQMKNDADVTKLLDFIYNFFDRKRNIYNDNRSLLMSFDCFEFGKFEILISDTCITIDLNRELLISFNSIDKHISLNEKYSDSVFMMESLYSIYELVYTRYYSHYNYIMTKYNK